MSYLLIGLGNPGKKFELTRHNAGKMFAAWLQAELSTINYQQSTISSQLQPKLEIIETECFMNESGKAVARILATARTKDEGRRTKDNKSDCLQPSAFSLQPLIVVHDDLDIPIGKFKIQFGKGPKQHKGVLSVEQALGTKEFWRVRIGVDSRKKEEGEGKGEEGEDYILERFSTAEKKTLKTVFPEIRSHLLKLINVIV